MQTSKRKIIFLDLIQQGPFKEETVEIDQIEFTIQKFAIGNDFKTLEAIIRTYDGHVDGFAISGLHKHFGLREPKIHNPAYLQVLRIATKTPVYVADEFYSFFSQWTLKKLLLDHPQIFFGKKVLFQCANVESIVQDVKNAGGIIYAADPLFLSGIPVLLRGIGQIELFSRIINRLKPVPNSKQGRVAKTLDKWIANSDVLVGFRNILPLIEDFDSLKGKMILVDRVDEETRTRLEAAGVVQIIESIPKMEALRDTSLHRLPILEAIIDQTRLVAESPLSLQDHFLKWLENSHFTPKPLRHVKGLPRKCAFIFHPLTQQDFWQFKAFRPFKNSPAFVRDSFEKAISLTPCKKIGELTGVVSEATGQEVVCDFYGIAATPKQLLAMNEEFLYKRLVECVELAKANGATLIGLGGYTKVAGDAGVTVARRSSIPVTNGNSYSASTTMWAARQMVETLGLVSQEKIGNRFKARAMVIGATGSIGRVSAMLISLVFQEVVLVATRPDKLLELREEILKLSPGIKVTVATQSHSLISDADLIITATSNQSGSILDIDLVKPGAVICDCSRPLDITPAEASKRPDVLVIESGEVNLPGNPKLNIDIGLPPDSVYACTAETVLLALEGRFESFSLSKSLSLSKTKEIYKMGVKHGAKLSAIRGPNGLITPEQIQKCRVLALERRKTWNLAKKSENRHEPQLF
jgi:predicted amino acid dehydrogenase